MALLNEIPFDQFEIFIGDGGSPEAFEPRCVVNAERGLAISPEYNDVVIPDCDDPRLPSVVRKYVTSVSAQITGSGMTSVADVEFFTNWALTGVAKNVRARIGTLEVSFAARLGPYNPTVSRDNTVESSIDLMSDGLVSVATVTV